MSGDILFTRRKSMSIDITIEEMEALPAESYELFDIRGEIERAHGILPNSTASSAGISQKNCRSRDMKHTA